MMSRELVRVENVSFTYDGGEQRALNDVTLSVREGEWLAIVGHNGSGKSTLAKLLNGLQFPSSGQIIVKDQVLSEETVWDVRKEIGMVFQNPDNQFVGSTVQDDVAFGLENNGIPRETMVERVKWALESVKMDAFLDQEPHHLSGGQKQRVAIASVLALQPSIIILDEATSMLDPRGREEVLETVRILKEDRTLTVVSITHDLEEASKADRIIVMNGGQVYREGNPAEIFRLDQELTDIGLDIPFSIKLSKALDDYKIPISDRYLSYGQLVKELCELNLEM
ncbi:MAG: energy-coupling factor ABC transporter ATP-binding protein [Bacillus sp. (in: firmicutes)]